MSRLAAAEAVMLVRRPSRSSASRSTCLSWVSRRSKSWCTRWRSREVSPVSTSPPSTLASPGFFSANPSRSERIVPQRVVASGMSSRMRVMRAKMLSSMKSISPSNMRALLGKWRYSAASETPTWRASAAVVIRLPLSSSSMMANACRICSRRRGLRSSLMTLALRRD